MPRLRIGTCSWKYPSWEGLVYSASKRINYLEEYARRFDTVEVDQWFWSLFGGSEPRLPNPSDVDEYRRSVPPQFRFSVKVPNSVTLTHYHSKAQADPLVPNPHFLSADLFARFLSLLDPLGDLLGPLMFQFEYLNRQKMKGQDEFQERLADFLGRTPTGPKYALEIRNPKWLNESYFEFVNRHALIPVLQQGYWMPPIRETYRDCREPLLRAKAAVIRLHGPDREGMEREAAGQWDRIVVRRDEELKATVGMTQELLGAGVDVYLNVNNHYEGCAPLTIRRLAALLGREARGGE
jgi:uncharacterized protein YecE (DUF72 family)